MLNQNPDEVKNITCIGAGPIGGGWTAWFLSRGYRVTTWLHDESEIDALDRLLQTAWSSLTDLGLSPGQAWIISNRRLRWKMPSPRQNSSRKAYLERLS